MKPQDLKPIGFAQLCAITRALYEPGIDDFEWSERIKWQLATYRFASLTGSEISKAVRAVERAVQRPLPRLAVTSRIQPVEPPPLSAAEARAFLREIGARRAS